jgi:malic enzyme
VDHVSDRTFLLHKGGKIEVRPKVPIKTRDDLSMAYTPGVARICGAIHDDPGGGVHADHQGQHGGDRLRRDGGPRARRHRPEAAMP